jgi:hypothetical protein
MPPGRLGLDLGVVDRIARGSRKPDQADAGAAFAGRLHEIETLRLQGFPVWLLPT